jgi:lipopolysaccharide biosynthesis protein
MNFQRIVKRTRAPLRQLYWAITPAVHGRSRPAHVPDLSAAVPFAYGADIPDPTLRICVVCHLFYDDLAKQMRDALCNIQLPFDLYVSTSDDAKRERIAAAFSDMGKGQVEVRVVPNRGRDIAPKLVTFADIYERYDYVLFVHGKKSAKSSAGERWRDTLIDGLIGSPATVRSILALFERHRSVGIVMVQHFEEIRPHLHWDHVFGRARRLAQRMGFNLTRRHVLDMPSGSMFWARTGALAPLLALGLRYEDFPVEKGQTRRTLQHTIERLFLFVAERAGYRWVKVADPRHYSARTPIETIAGPSELDAFVKAASFDLLTSNQR